MSFHMFHAFQHIVGDNINLLVFSSFSIRQNKTQTLRHRKSDVEYRKLEIESQQQEHARVNVERKSQQWNTQKKAYSYLRTT